MINQMILVPEVTGIKKITRIIPIFKKIKLARLSDSKYFKLSITPTLEIILKPLNMTLTLTARSIIVPAIKKSNPSKNKIIIALS